MPEESNSRKSQSPGKRPSSISVQTLQSRHHRDDLSRPLLDELTRADSVGETAGAVIRADTRYDITVARQLLGENRIPRWLPTIARPEDKNRITASSGRDRRIRD